MRRRLVKNRPPDAAAASTAAGSTRDLATTVVLDFEGVGDYVAVGSYYAGANGGGPDYGVVFGSSVVAIDAVGNGNIINEPSPSTVLFFAETSNTYMTVSAGFTGLSFYYASNDDAIVTVYDGPDGTGTVLASLAVPRTGLCIYDYPACGDPHGYYGRWILFLVQFSGVAASVRFTGPNIEGDVFIDDIRIVPAEPPCTRTTYWLWDPKTDAPVGELLNNSASCIAVPYNIEVRPCIPPKTAPVVLQLKNATTLKILKTQNEVAAPYFLWGDNTATGDVFKNTAPLPKGAYWLSSKIDGVQEKIRFTKTC
jgi:hypothetical protein